MGLLLRVMSKVVKHTCILRVPTSCVDWPRSLVPVKIGVTAPGKLQSSQTPRAQGNRVLWLWL